MSNMITRPSSKPFRPTPHWSMSAQRVVVRLVERVALRLDLRVDGDLGTRPLLDASDRSASAEAIVWGLKMPA